MAAIGVGVALLVTALQFAAGAALQEPMNRRVRVALVTAAASAVWLTLWYQVAATGALQDFEARPAPMFLVFPATGGMGIIIGFSRWGDRLLKGLPIGVLILAQSFRLPLEWVMHEAALQKIMPMQMSWSGYNFDVLTGAAALVIGVLALLKKAPRWLMWAWVAMGFVTLVTVVAIGLASTPVFHAFGTEPEQLNTWLAEAPYVWLPVVMVAFALGGQILVVRSLLKESP